MVCGPTPMTTKPSTRTPMPYVPMKVAAGLAFAAPGLFYLQIPLTLLLFILPPAGAGILLLLLFTWMGYYVAEAKIIRPIQRLQSAASAVAASGYSFLTYDLRSAPSCRSPTRWAPGTRRAARAAASRRR